MIRLEQQRMNEYLISNNVILPTKLSANETDHLRCNKQQNPRIVPPCRCLRVSVPLIRQLQNFHYWIDQKVVLRTTIHREERYNYTVLNSKKRILDIRIERTLWGQGTRIAKCVGKPFLKKVSFLYAFWEERQLWLSILSTSVRFPQPSFLDRKMRIKKAWTRSSNLAVEIEAN